MARSDDGWQQQRRVGPQQMSRHGEQAPFSGRARKSKTGRVLGEQASFSGRARKSKPRAIKQDVSLANRLHFPGAPGIEKNDHRIETTKNHRETHLKIIPLRITNP